jgi:hypothetical protein
MATKLEKEVKRGIEIDGTPYTVIIDPTGLRLVGKGKRNPTAQLQWKDLVSGDAALATALNASLQNK